MEGLEVEPFIGHAFCGHLNRLRMPQYGHLHGDLLLYCIAVIQPLDGFMGVADFGTLEVDSHPPVAQRNSIFGANGLRLQVLISWMEIDLLHQESHHDDPKGYDADG